MVMAKKANYYLFHINVLKTTCKIKIKITEYMNLKKVNRNQSHKPLKRYIFVLQYESDTQVINKLYCRSFPIEELELNNSTLKLQTNNSSFKNVRTKLCQ